jgi:hypothetical protein
MGHLFFFLAVGAACLLWSAAFIAAAARTRQGWMRWLFVAVAVLVPPLALVPWVWCTGVLAAQGFPTNWFASTLTATLSAIIGGAWIARAGLAPRAAPFAADWPLLGLAGMFVLAKAVAAGTLLFMNNAVTAEGRSLRVEAAQMMAAALPPAPSPDDNAAPLYLRAFASLASDKQVGKAESPFNDPLAADPTSPEVQAILERHSITLDLLRRATDKPGCRFDRDWSRPSLDMLLPEIQEMRQAARLLMLAARRAAATGEGAAAVSDVVRIHRLGMHAAGEPILVSGLVGQAIDALALETLADVLPKLGKDDLLILDEDAVRDFVATPIRYQRAFLGEEAFGLATFADLSDGARGVSILGLLRSVPGGPTPRPFDGPLAVLYRCFLLPADIAGYRAIMQRYQDIVTGLAGPAPKPFPQLVKEFAVVEDDLKSRRAGIFSALLAPALSGVIKSQSKSVALHAAAGVLVAATRSRLAAGSLPERLVPDVLPTLPRDPFTADAPLVAKRSVDGWLVYAVGPDGADDGGPVPTGADAVAGNDDIGLRLGVWPNAG